MHSVWVRSKSLMETLLKFDLNNLKNVKNTASQVSKTKFDPYVYIINVNGN